MGMFRREAACRRRHGFQCPAIAIGTHWNHADLECERDRIFRLMQVAHDVGCAQCRVAGKRQFHRRCENAHLGRGARRRQDEAGLGQVELQCQRLHLMACQAAAVLEHTERIAGQAVAIERENVDQSIVEAHGVHPKKSR